MLPPLKKPAAFESMTLNLSRVAWSKVLKNLCFIQKLQRYREVPLSSKHASAVKMKKAQLHFCLL